MKCPNIYCIMQENGKCICTDGVCGCKTKFEQDHCPTEEEYKRTGYPMVESLYCECGMTMIITNKIVTEAPCLNCGKKNSYDDLLELGELPF